MVGDYAANGAALDAALPRLSDDVELMQRVRNIFSARRSSAELFALIRELRNNARNLHGALKLAVEG